MRLGILGLFSIWMSVSAMSGPTPGGIPADTGDTGDTGSYDTGETGEIIDTGETGEVIDTGNDTADTAKDTGDTAEVVDTGWTDGQSAAELAGEEGGFGCATVTPSGGLSVLVIGMLLALRRRD